jgi:hypothetical protein
MNLICPMSSSQLKKWAYEEVFRPYMEGVNRIKCAWVGIDFHSIYQPKLSLKQRMVSFFVGVSLLIPFFNVSIWKSWETFGAPTPLSRPYRLPNKGLSNNEIKHFDSARYCLAVPKEPPSPVSRSSSEDAFTLEPLSSVIAVCPVQAVQNEFLRYDESEGAYQFSSNWKITPTDDQIETVKTCPHNAVRAIYSKHWLLQEYDYTSTDQTQRFHACLEGKHLVIEGTRDGKKKTKTYELTERYPWIQQATLGFREFIKSKDKTLSFYGIDPRSFSLSYLVAEKICIQSNGLQKVEIRLMGLLSFIWKADVWFDPQTGILQKMEHNSGPFTAMNTTQFVSATYKNKEDV